MIGLSAPAWGLVAATAILVIGVGSLLFFMTRGWLTLDLGWGRSLHPVGPIILAIGAPRELVFEQISSPYLGRTPQALRGKLEILDRSDRLVVAAHRTKLRRFVSVTVESVVFEPPERVGFRHLRGPVPHAVEEFLLREAEEGTELEYRGELGIDFWVLGRLAARFSAVPSWEKAVRASSSTSRPRPRNGRLLGRDVRSAAGKSEGCTRQPGSLSEWSSRSGRSAARSREHSARAMSQRAPRPSRSRATAASTRRFRVSGFFAPSIPSTNQRCWL